MRKYTDNGSGNEPKIIIRQGRENYKSSIGFDKLARIHFFAIKDGSILASEVSITTITKITPVDIVEQFQKKINNTLNVFIGEN